GCWSVTGVQRCAFPISERAAVDDRSDARTRQGTRCAECGSALHYGDSFCPLCGLARSSAGRMADLAKIARQLDIFLNQGKLDAEDRKSVVYGRCVQNGR